MLGQLSESEIKDILHDNVIGRIGCSSDSMTYIVPVSYVYMGDHLLCHSYDGMKIEMMRNNPSVCFEVDEIKDYRHWQCVIIQGSYKELVTEAEINAAKESFPGTGLQMKVSETALPPDSQPKPWHSDNPKHGEPIFYRIDIIEVSGRFEKTV